MTSTITTGNMSLEIAGNATTAPPMGPGPYFFGYGLIEWKVVMNGFLVPPLLVFTLVINILFCIVLLKPNMRSPTNVLLVAMAVSDTLTGLSPLPFYFYAYTLGNYKEWAPYYLCDFFNVIQRSLPTIFHTASIWLTVALATQRYVFVCHSVVAKQWCTIGNMIKAIAIIYMVSSVVHISTFIDTYHTSIHVPSRLVTNRTVHSCLRLQTQWFSDHQTKFYNVYIWFRIIFIHTVPCASLVVLNFLLIRTMREAKRRRTQLLQQNKKSESRRVKDTNSTTQMMIGVVGVFLIVEIPSAFYLVIYAILNSTGTVMERKASEASTLILNFIILASYPVTFFIYCGMSKQFRDIFKELFLPKRQPPAPADREHSQYTTLPNGNDHNVTNAANNNADTAL